MIEHDGQGVRGTQVIDLVGMAGGTGVSHGRPRRAAPRRSRACSRHAAADGWCSDRRRRRPAAAPSSETGAACASAPEPCGPARPGPARYSSGPGRLWRSGEWKPSPKARRPRRCRRGSSR
jgi:hypothetical protein